MGNTARIITDFDVDSLPGCSKLWVLRVPRGDRGRWLVRSVPEGTDLAYLDVNIEDSVKSEPEDEWYPANIGHGAPLLRALFDRSLATLAAGLTVSGIIIQVTSREIRALPANWAHRPSEGVRSWSSNDLNILHASINQRESCILLALDVNGAPQLCFFRLHVLNDVVEFQGNEGGSLSQSESLSIEPNASIVQRLNDGMYAFVGDPDGQLLCFAVSDVALRFACRQHLSGDDAVCESIVIRAHDNAGDEWENSYVLCSLRNGLLCILLFETSRANSRCAIEILETC